MPNRTIYVSDADLPVFEEAQRLAGDNLSATIAQALRRFVQVQQARDRGFDEITVRVGKSAYSQKRFLGRLLAKVTFANRDDIQEKSYKIFETARGQLALYSTISANPHYVPGGGSWEGASRADVDWSAYANVWVEDDEYRLDVFKSLEDMKPHIPEELYENVKQSLSDEPIEILDI